MNATTDNVFPFIPRYGSMWPTAGGRNAGPCDHGYLIVQAFSLTPMPWPAALEWARSKDFGGHRDWDLPSLSELLLLNEALKAANEGAPMLRWWTHEPVGSADAMTVCFHPFLSVHWNIAQPNYAVAVRRHSIN